jgi:hypothetical protein
MKRIFSKGVGRLGAFVVASAGAVTVMSLQPATSQGAAAGGGAGGMVQRVGPAEDFIKLGFKFDGAESCSNADCHGAAQPQPKGATTKAEYKKWSGGDAHHKAFETLVNDASGMIAKKLNIADATASERCTSCHALNVPANLQGKQYNIQEGVTCASCHGPSGKWLEPHATEGWTDKQRKALPSHDALLKQWGLYDTKSPLARAEKCTSCHLAIDADMVAAGHPQPVFELAYFSKDADHGGVYQSQHWREPNVPFYDAQLWATGQVVALRDAMLQLARRAGGKDANAVTSAYNQAMGHASVLPGLAALGAVPQGALDAQIKAVSAAVQAKNMQQVATAANAAAQAANQQIANVGKMKLAQPGVTAALQAVANNSAAATSEFGINQQSLAIYDLYNAYAGVAKPANAKAVQDALINAFFPEKPHTPQTFAAAVKQVQGQLPK